MKGGVTMVIYLNEKEAKAVKRMLELLNANASQELKEISEPILERINRCLELQGYKPHKKR